MTMTSGNVTQISLENLLCPESVFFSAVEIAVNDEDAELSDVAAIAVEQAVEDDEIVTILDGMQLNLTNHLVAHFKAEAGEAVEERYQPDLSDGWLVRGIMNGPDYIPGGVPFQDS